MWKWNDHILQTIHGIWEFLDFLKMGDQDIQLSCWEKIHLKLVSWCKFRIKKYPFLAVEITGPLSISGKFSDWLQILPWCWLPWHMRPIRTWISSFKPFPSIRTRESTTVDQLWLSRVLDLTVHFWWIPNPNSLRLWLQKMSQDIWTLDDWSWCPNSTRMATIHCFDWLLTV